MRDIYYAVGVPIPEKIGGRRVCKGIYEELAKFVALVFLPFFFSFTVIDFDTFSSFFSFFEGNGGRRGRGVAFVLFADQQQQREGGQD